MGGIQHDWAGDLDEYFEQEERKRKEQHQQARDLHQEIMRDLAGHPAPCERSAVENHGGAKMKRLVLDLETTVQRFDGKTDNSPFNPENKCVSAHFGMLGWDTVDEVFTLVFNHNDKPDPDCRSLLENML